MSKKTKSKNTKQSKGHDTRRRKGRTQRTERPGTAAKQSLPPWSGHVGAIAVLFVLSFSFFAPIHFTGKTIIASDTVGWRSMAESIISFENETGKTALWATNMFSGMPAYLISYRPQAWQLDDIARLLRKIVWPSSHFVFLLVGMYLLAFVLTGRKIPSMLSAVAMGLTTYIPVILVAGHNTKFVTLCFAPWLVLAFIYVVRKPGLIAGMAFAAALAVSLRSSHIQITYYFTFLILVMWIAEGIAAWRRQEIQAFVMTTLFLAVGSVLALCMVAQPYLSIVEYKPFTIRGASTGGGSGGLDWEYAMTWSQGRAELITLAVADAFGGADQYWGPKPGTGGPHYVGLVVLVLSAIGVWCVRTTTVIALAVATVLMTLFALGDNFAVLNRFMFAFLPLFDAFRAPETWLVAVSFSLSLLAAYGFAHVLHLSESPSSRDAWRPVLLTAVAGPALILILTLGRGVFFDFERPNEVELIADVIVRQDPSLTRDDPRVARTAEAYVDEQRAERSARLQRDGIRSVFFGVGALLLLVGLRFGKVNTTIVQAGLVLLAGLDLWGVDRRYLNRSQLVEKVPVERRIPTYPFDRFIQDASYEPGRFRTLSLEANPTTNARPAYHYETVGGYHGAKLRVYQDFMDQVLFKEGLGRPNANALDLLNTRFVAAAAPLPGLLPVYRDETTGIIVLENPDYVPRSFFVDSVEVIEDIRDVWNRVAEESFDPRTTAVVEAPVSVGSSAADSLRRAAVTMYSPREIRVQARTNDSALLVLSEVYYPRGWKATIDGNGAEIVRVDGVLRGLVVPSGTHEVRLRFDPLGHRLGVATSWSATILVYLSLIGYGLLLLRGRLRRDTAGTASETASESTSSGTADDRE